MLVGALRLFPDKATTQGVMAPPLFQALAPELDMITVRCRGLKHVLLTHSYPIASCDSDHSLLCRRPRCCQRNFIAPNKKGSHTLTQPKCNIHRSFRNSKSLLKMLCPLTTHATTLLSHGNTCVRHFRNQLLLLLGERWFDAKPTELRRCANEYWQELSHNIKTVAATGNIGGMYKGIKKTLGSTQSVTAPPKTNSREVITDKAKQMERLRTPGNDSIHPDVIWYCKTTLLQPPHSQFCQFWSEGGVPQHMRNAKIITLHKNNGNGSE